MMRLAGSLAGLLVIAGWHTFAAQPVQSPVPIDFSFAGFEAGKPIPSVKAVVAVKPSGLDDTSLLQTAIGHVAVLSLQADASGVLLCCVQDAFTSQVNCTCLQAASYFVAAVLVLMEQPSSLKATIGTLTAAGGETDPKAGAPLAFEDEIVAAGARTFRVASTNGLATGEHIAIRCPSTSEWIKSIDVTGLPGAFADARLDWHPSSQNFGWDRTNTAVDPSGEVEVDASIATALEKRYGSGTVEPVQPNAALQNIGVEDLTLESSYDRRYLKDEEHSGIAIALDHVEVPGLGTSQHVTSSALLYALACVHAASPLKTAVARLPSLSLVATGVSPRLRSAGPGSSLLQRGGHERLCHWPADRRPECLSRLRGHQLSRSNWRFRRLGLRSVV
jgi:hypothetical protein